MRFDRPWGCRLILSVGVVVTVTSAPLMADEPVVTNLGLMETMCREVTEEVIATIPSRLSVRAVLLAPSGRDEPHEFLGDIFTRSLTDKGIKVYTSSPPKVSESTSVDDPATTGLTLQFQAMDFDLRYVKTYRSYLIGGKRVKRHANLRVLAKLVDPSDHSVVWVGEATRSSDDSFSFGDIAAVEAGLYTFNKPPRVNSNWGKFVEPVVVTGIIVGLIYLFFANQTDNS